MAKIINTKILPSRDFTTKVAHTPNHGTNPLPLNNRYSTGGLCRHRFLLQWDLIAKGFERFMEGFGIVVIVCGWLLVLRGVVEIILMKVH